MSNKTEIINITGESTKAIDYNDARKENFGVYPKLQAWIKDDGGIYYLSDVQPIIDAPPPATSVFNFDFGSTIDGFIVIK